MVFGEGLGLHGIDQRIEIKQAPNLGLRQNQHYDSFFSNPSAC